MEINVTVGKYKTWKNNIQRKYLFIYELNDNIELFLLNLLQGNVSIWYYVLSKNYFQMKKCKEKSSYWIEQLMISTYGATYSLDIQPR